VATYEPALMRMIRVRMVDQRLRKLHGDSDIFQSVMGSFLVRMALGQYELRDAEDVMRLLAVMVRNKVAGKARRKDVLRESDPVDDERAGLVPAPEATPNKVVELYMKLTAADNDRAGEVWKTGLVTFPDSALLKTKLGFVHLMRSLLFFQDDAASDYARASELVRSALARPHLSPLERRLAHWLFAYVSCQEGNYDRALQEMRTTLELAPYDMFQLGDLSTIPILAGRPDEALRMLDKALEADPANRAFYQQLRGWAFSVAGRHAESVKALDEGIPLPMVPLLQAVNHVELGQLDEARRLVAKALAQLPDLTLAKWESANPYRDRALLKKQLTDLAAAGLR
jgi:tetratricopeptide (TPR) repeat protein